MTEGVNEQQDSALEPGRTSGLANGPPGGEGLDTGRLDPARVEELYCQFEAELRAFLLGVLRDRVRMEEALQCTFRRCLESGHTARPETLRGWLFRVAMNEALGIKRRDAAEQRGIERYRQSVLEQENDVGDFDGIDSLVLREEVERLKVELECLPAEQRAVIVCRVYEGKTFAVIADEQQVPLGTVLTRMRLGMARLVSRMKRG